LERTEESKHQAGRKEESKQASRNPCCNLVTKSSGSKEFSQNSSSLRRLVPTSLHPLAFRSLKRGRDLPPPLLFFRRFAIL
jgi:CRISPR/Cas system endoribonuclease Cas6 (RAMP superfamily)